jgi:cytochrome c biogenesis protein CcdA/thiol-disulfide isomerase/thioredoxin
MSAVDVGLAFVEGLALIVSPCILPVLPLVLSTSIDGGKARPFGIITGFVAAFSAFVLLSRQLIEALRIDTEVIRYVSLALLFALGMILLIDKFSDAFSRWTQGAADIGSRLGSGKGGGFASGLAIGALIGLVWTPCAGPILAAVLVQAIRQQTDLQSVFVTLAFAVGAGFPMLVIALTGRTLLRRFGFLSAHAHTLRKVFAVLILLSVVWLGFGPDVQTHVAPTETASSGDAEALEAGLEKSYPAPELVGIQDWINSKPLMLANLKGKVVLIDFWTYSCINCVRTLPTITSWDQKYRDKGLVIIGVHSPEFEFEKNVDNIKTAIGKYGINYPVAVDNTLSTWVNFKNRYWPAHYLIDHNGQVVYTHFGEGDYAVTENNIRYLLGLKGKANETPSENTVAANQTPETYLGTKRAENFGGMQALQRDTSAAYELSEVLPEHCWSLGGKWKVEGEKITTQDHDAVLRLNFTARKVFLVMGTANGQPQRISLQLNGKPIGNSAGKDVTEGSLMVGGHALYELVNQPVSQNGLLEIDVSGPGLEAYAFTFGG